MIEKIVQIKRIGYFRNHTANGDVPFRKLTLIYGENGRGKTTLCAIFRSLQTGNHAFITERKSLGATDPSFAHIRINNTGAR